MFKLDVRLIQLLYSNYLCMSINSKKVRQYNGQKKKAIVIEDLARMLPTNFGFIWPSGFRRKFFFRNQPIRNKNGLWRSCLLTDHDEMSILYRGPPLSASYQVSVNLAEEFQRRRLKCEKLTDDGRQTTDAKDGKSSHCQSETRIACGSHVC